MGEYDEGQHLQVRLVTEDPANSASIELIVLRSFRPFTLSVTCLVSVVSHPHTVDLPDTCIIKLYDRRHLNNVRDYYNGGRKYSEAKEAAYRRYLDDPNAVHDRRSLGDLGEGEDEGAFEDRVEKLCEKMYNAEIRAYQALKPLQGSVVPRLFGCLTYASPNTASASANDPSTAVTESRCESFSASLYRARGVLLEYVPSITLDRLIVSRMEMVPPDYGGIAAACEAAMSVMKALAGYPILNKDVRLENMLVRMPETDSDTIQPKELQCVAIDFAATRLRYSDETDEQWRRAKQAKGEGGAIGLVALNLLGQTAKRLSIEIDPKTVWQYQRDTRWDREHTAEELALMEADSLWGFYPEPRD